MLDAVRLEGFKRFQQITLSLTQLNVLTGLNGSGKSSVIQALLLAHAATVDVADTVPLLGQGLDLGKASDVLNVDAASSLVKIAVDAAGTCSEWHFDAGGPLEGDVPYLRVASRPEAAPPPIGVGGHFIFLAAERLGPRTSHPAAPLEPEQAVVGEDGRYVAHALAVNLRREVATARRHPTAGTISTLAAQTEAWLSELVGPTQLEAALIPRTALATLHIRAPGLMSEWMLPTNTGFGVSYSLPVVVASLLIPAGGLLIVDSPEAHLHPAAQSAIGGLLAVVAGSGVQVVLETHSDHVLNGIRKAVAIGNALPAEKVAVTYFGRGASPQRLKMDSRGGLDAWPPGFFDQLQTDLGTLTRARRSS